MCYEQHFSHKRYVAICVLDELLVPPIYCTTGDLWAHLETASGKPVADVMSTWTQQLGYPVITVEAKQVGVHTLLPLCRVKRTV